MGIIRRHLLSFLTSPMLLPAALGAGEGRTIHLPRNTTNADPQLPYVSDLLRLALLKAGSKAEVQYVDIEMQQSRSMTELLGGLAPFDLMWSMTTPERERSGLRVIRFPIDRGLLGWRVVLVRSKDRRRWQSVRTLTDLKAYVAGQGHDWPDVEVLRANGLPVVTSHSYDSLFRMLKVGRFDYLPRSILEADAELASGRHAELSLLPDLMLRYPTAAYFFVNPAQSTLAEDLARGLRLSAEDGSFQALFKQHFGSLIKAHSTPTSRVLHLANPSAPAEADSTDLWLRPGAIFR